jgi:hypothetical protein
MTRKDIAMLAEAYTQVLSDASKILLEGNSYLNKLKKLNPGWDPEKAKLDFQDEYDPDDPEDIAQSVDYDENAAEYLDNISSFVPGVGIGDWVEVYGRNLPGRAKTAIGKIVGETTLQGYDYGYMGYKGPSIIPAWKIKSFIKDEHGEYKDKQPNDYAFYDNAVYFNVGQILYPQHDEIQSNKSVEKYETYTKANTFKRLPKQNLRVVTID